MHAVMKNLFQEDCSYHRFSSSMSFALVLVVVLDLMTNNSILGNFSVICEELIYSHLAA